MRRWFEPHSPPIHLFCDAAGDPQRIAAVLFVDGKILYSDCPPPGVILEMWNDRRDQQIMGLELLSIALGLSVFEDEIRGRRVVIHSDNRGAECCARKGIASSFDHCCLIHNMWSHLAVLRVAAWIVRVPTDDNIADLPSRSCYDILRGKGASQRAARMAPLYLEPAAWSVFNRKTRGM